MAIIERVSTLERLVADAAAQQAKTEKAIDRFVEGMAAFRDGLSRDTEAFKESSRRGNEAFMESARRSNAAYEESARRGNEAFMESSRQSNAAYEESARLSNEAFMESSRQSNAAYEESARLSNEAFMESSRQSNAAFEQSMRRTIEAFSAAEHQDNEAFKRSMEAGLEQSRRAWNKTWGDLANKMGTVVEDVAAPNVRTVAETYFGQSELRHWGVRAHVPRLGNLSDMREFDVIAFSETHFFLNETRTTPRIADAEAFVAFLPHLPEYFPGVERMELVPILSAFGIEDHIVTYLTRHGVYCMVMGGDTMALANFHEVQARRAEG